VGSGVVSVSVAEVILRKDAASASGELPPAARGVGTPTPLSAIVIKARVMMLR